MSRYIDANKIIYQWLIDPNGQEHDGVTLQSIINKMPTIDAVPVIRCKDCKYYMGNWYCEAWNNSPGFPAVDGNMFCSMGERKDETD